MLELSTRGIGEEEVKRSMTSSFVAGGAVLFSAIRAPNSTKGRTLLRMMAGTVSAHMSKALYEAQSQRAKS